MFPDVLERFLHLWVDTFWIAKLDCFVLVWALRDILFWGVQSKIQWDLNDVLHSKMFNTPSGALCGPLLVVQEQQSAKGLYSKCMDRLLQRLFEVDISKMLVLVDVVTLNLLEEKKMWFNKTVHRVLGADEQTRIGYCWKLLLFYRVVELFGDFTSMSWDQPEWGGVDFVDQEHIYELLPVMQFLLHKHIKGNKL